MANNPHIIEFDDSAYNAQQCSELLANNDTDEETSSTVEMTFDLENEPNNDIDDSMSINSLLFQNGDTDNEIIEEPDAFNHYPFTSHLNTFGIDHENETGINFLYDMRRVQNPLYTSKYLSTLADVKYGLLFRTFFSGDVSVDNGVNLISYLDLTCHRQLINALDLSQKKNEAIIAPYKDNIEKLFSDLFINLNKFIGRSDVCLEQFWSISFVIINEAIKLELHATIERFFQFIPKVTSSNTDNKYKEQTIKYIISNKQLIKHLPVVVNYLKRKPSELASFIQKHYILLNIAEKKIKKEKYFQWSEVDGVFHQIFYAIGHNRALTHADKIEEKKEIKKINFYSKASSIFAQYYSDVSYKDVCNKKALDKKRKAEIYQTPETKKQKNYPQFVTPEEKNCQTTIYDMNVCEDDNEIVGLVTPICDKHTYKNLFGELNMTNCLFQRCDLVTPENIDDDIQLDL